MQDKKDIKMDFTVFISGLLAEGLMALGLMKNPITQKIQKDLRHASLVIDTLTMLKEKTSGNLAKEESSNLEEAIHHLKMGYVAGMKENAKEEDAEKPEGEEKKA